MKMYTNFQQQIKLFGGYNEVLRARYVLGLIILHPLLDLLNGESAASGLNFYKEFRQGTVLESMRVRFCNNFSSIFN